MTRHIAAILAILCTIVTANAETEFPEGEFQVINTAAFKQQEGVRTPLNTGSRTGNAEIEIRTDGSFELGINGTRIVLFPFETGLAGLAWDAQGSSLMEEMDIEALNPARSRGDIPVWGAELAWPGLGLTRMVVMPLGPAAYSGILISFPENRTVVRQMEFRQVFGPLNRPGSPPGGPESAQSRH